MVSIVVMEEVRECLVEGGPDLPLDAQAVTCDIWVILVAAGLELAGGSFCIDYNCTSIAADILGEWCKCNRDSADIISFSWSVWMKIEEIIRVTEFLESEHLSLLCLDSVSRINLVS